MTIHFGKKFIFRIISKVLIFQFFILSSAFAQEEEKSQPSSLKEQFDELKSTSETYNEYKVIKTYKLNSFWNTVKDSLESDRNAIIERDQNIEGLQNEIKSLNDEVADLKARLDASEAMNDSITFIGIPLKKVTYNIICWSLILGLAGLAVYLYASFKRGAIVKRNTVKQHEKLVDEFEEYKKNSRERQIKLKRDLQTEVNKNEELKEMLAKAKKTT